MFSVADKRAEKFQAGDPLTDFTVELEDKNANKINLALSDLGTLYPMLEGDFLKWPLGMIGMSQEAVFQNFTIDLSEIHVRNADFDVNSIQSIRFIFDLVEKGGIYIQNVGIRYD